MALDLIDKFIGDLCAVTESLMDIENTFDIAAWQPFPLKNSTGKDKPSPEENAKGIHKSVC
jgi:hypothetical protein